MYRLFFVMNLLLICDSDMYQGAVDVLTAYCEGLPGGQVDYEDDTLFLLKNDKNESFVRELFEYFPIVFNSNTVHIISDHVYGGTWYEFPYKNYLSYSKKQELDKYFDHQVINKFKQYNSDMTRQRYYSSDLL